MLRQRHPHTKNKSDVLNHKRKCTAPNEEDEDHDRDKYSTTGRGIFRWCDALNNSVRALPQTPVSTSHVLRHKKVKFTRPHHVALAVSIVVPGAPADESRRDDQTETS